MTTRKPTLITAVYIALGLWVCLYALAGFPSLHW